MSQNSWLFYELKKINNVKVENKYEPLIILKKGKEEYKIISPSSDEYLITVDLVQKAKEKGANVISYPKSWSRASTEAIIYGKHNNVLVIPHSELFKILKNEKY